MRYKALGIFPTRLRQCIILCVLLLAGCSTQNQALAVILPNVSSQTADAVTGQFIKSMSSVNNWGCGLHFINEQGLSRMNIPFQDVVNVYWGDNSKRMGFVRFMRHDGYLQAAGGSFVMLRTDNSGAVAGEIGFTILEFKNQRMAHVAFNYFFGEHKPRPIKGIQYSNSYGPDNITFQESRFLISTGLNWDPGNGCASLLTKVDLAIYHSIRS